MIRDEALYLEDIWISINKLEEISNKFSKEQFDENWIVQEAAIRLLGIIGEAANKLSNDFKGKHQDIPWNQVIGMRNIAIHAYYEVDLDRVWDTINNDLASVKQTVAPELEKAA
jgi:uncharacterized protein with HEPN domain